MTMKIDNLSHWATTAAPGEYAAYYEDLTVEEESGHYTVTQDASGGVIWTGEADSALAAYDAACESDHGSRCGWSDATLAEANRILARGGLTLRADDRGLVALRIEDTE